MEKKEVTLTMRFDPKTHRSLKILAAKEGKTVKQCMLEGLDKLFPGWRDEEKK